MNRCCRQSHCTQFTVSNFPEIMIVDKIFMKYQEFLENFVLTTLLGFAE